VGPNKLQDGGKEEKDRSNVRDYDGGIRTMEDRNKKKCGGEC
jgi:hypothetical protein